MDWLNEINSNPFFEERVLNEVHSTEITLSFSIGRRIRVKSM